MSTTSKKYSTIDEYIDDAATPDVREVLEKIRKLIQAKVPSATETISYQIPAFKTDKVFIYFAAFKKHIGVYPPVEGSKELQEALLPYRGEKGNFKFPLSEPIPYDLIGQIAEALSQKHTKSKLP